MSSPTSRWLTMQPRSLVEDLDRILDRDDVLVPRPVDVVEHRRERGRLSGARGAGAEDEAAMLFGQAGDAGRQAQLLEGGHVLRNHAEGERDRAALAKAVDAEARQVLGGVGDVELAVLVEEGKLGRDELRHDTENRVEIDLRQRRAVAEERQVAVPAQNSGTSNLEMNVARAEFHGTPQHSVQVHNRPDRQPAACS